MIVENLKPGTRYPDLITFRDDLDRKLAEKRREDHQEFFSSVTVTRRGKGGEIATSVFETVGFREFPAGFPGTVTAELTRRLGRHLEPGEQYTVSISFHLGVDGLHVIGVADGPSIRIAGIVESDFSDMD